MDAERWRSRQMHLCLNKPGELRPGIRVLCLGSGYRATANAVHRIGVGGGSAAGAGTGDRGGLFEAEGYTPWQCRAAMRQGKRARSGARRTRKGQAALWENAWERQPVHELSSKRGSLPAAASELHSRDSSKDLLSVWRGFGRMVLEQERHPGEEPESFPVLLAAVP